MKRCVECGGMMGEGSGTMPDGIPYKFLHCAKCGEEVLTMDQLHEVAEKYRAMKKYRAKLSRWGASIGMRIPKDLEKQYHLKPERVVTIVPEKQGMRIIVSG